MQLAWSKIWTRVIVSISYDDNHYTTGTSTIPICVIYGYVERSHALKSEKHSKHWRLSWFRYETFITFLTFRFFETRKEGHNFIMLTVPFDPTTRGASRRPHWSGLTQVQKSTGFVLLQISTHYLFSKIILNSQPIASGHDVIHIPSPISYPGFLLRHLWLSHPPRTSVNTCAQCVALPVHKAEKFLA